MRGAGKRGRVGAGEKLSRRLGKEGRLEAGDLGTRGWVGEPKVPFSDVEVVVARFPDLENHVRRGLGGLVDLKKCTTVRIGLDATAKALLIRVEKVWKVGTGGMVGGKAVPCLVLLDCHVRRALCGDEQRG